MLDEVYLNHLDDLSRLAAPAPWTVMWEGRDHESGDSFILVGTDEDRRQDFYIFRETSTAGLQDLELIAEARNAIPVLIDEIRRLKGLLGDTSAESGVSG